MRNDGFKEAVIRARQADIMKALQGVIHHNDAVKPQYKLPESLIRQINQAILLQQGNIQDAMEGECELERARR